MTKLKLVDNTEVSIEQVILAETEKKVSRAPQIFLGLFVILVGFGAAYLDYYLFGG